MVKPVESILLGNESIDTICWHWMNMALLLVFIWIQVAFW